MPFSYKSFSIRYILPLDGSDLTWKKLSRFPGREFLWFNGATAEHLSRSKQVRTPVALLRPLFNC